MERKTLQIKYSSLLLNKAQPSVNIQYVPQPDPCPHFSLIFCHSLFCILLYSNTIPNFIDFVRSLINEGKKEGRKAGRMEREINCFINYTQYSILEQMCWEKVASKGLKIEHLGKYSMPIFIWKIKHDLFQTKLYLNL